MWPPLIFPLAQSDLLLFGCCLALILCIHIKCLGSLFTIITFLSFKDARNVATSLIFSLALSDLFSSSSTSFWWIWTAHDEQGLCYLQASLLMFGLCASLLWSLMIGMIYFFLFFFFIKHVLFVLRVDNPLFQQK